MGSFNATENVTMSSCLMLSTAATRSSPNQSHSPQQQRAATPHKTAAAVPNQIRSRQQPMFGPQRVFNSAAATTRCATQQLHFTEKELHCVMAFNLMQTICDGHSTPSRQQLCKKRKHTGEKDSKKGERAVDSLLGTCWWPEFGQT